jgi:membrane protein
LPTKHRGQENPAESGIEYRNHNPHRLPSWAVRRTCECVMVDLFKTAFAEWLEDNTFRLAASLAFYTIFSIAPILLISVEIAGFIFSRGAARQQLIMQVEELAGIQGGQAAAQILDSVGLWDGNWVAIVVGLVTVLVGSTAVFAELQSALNQIWDVMPDPRRSAVKSLLRTRIRSFAVVLTVGFLLLVSLVISAALAAAHNYLAAMIPITPWMWQLINLLVSLAVTSLLFAMVYKYLPDVQITWRDVWVGALVTAILFNIGKTLIGLYLGRTAVASTYGAAGSFVVILLWVYYSALISFFGAEFTQVYARKYGSKIRPEPHAIRIGRKSDFV